MAVALLNLAQERCFVPLIVLWISNGFILQSCWQIQQYSRCQLELEEVMPAAATAANPVAISCTVEKPADDSVAFYSATSSRSAWHKCCHCLWMTMTLYGGAWLCKTIISTVQVDICGGLGWLHRAGRDDNLWQSVAMQKTITSHYWTGTDDCGKGFLATQTNISMDDVPPSFIPL